jgi:hypothetical protein
LRDRRTHLCEEIRRHATGEEILLVLGGRVDERLRRAGEVAIPKPP